MMLPCCQYKSHDFCILFEFSTSFRDLEDQISQKLLFKSKERRNKKVARDGPNEEPALCFASLEQEHLLYMTDTVRNDTLSNTLFSFMTCGFQHIFRFINKFLQSILTWKSRRNFRLVFTHTVDYAIEVTHSFGSGWVHVI